MKEWLSDIGNWSWFFLGLFFIRFLFKEVPALIRNFRGVDKYGDDDPSGNDNINRQPYDYL